MLSLGILSLFQRPPNRKYQGFAESRPPRSDYNSQDASSTWECARASGAGVEPAPSSWGNAGGWIRPISGRRDGGRAGTGNRAAGSPRRLVKEVGGRSGRQSGKPSPVLSRKAVCGRGQESHRPWWMRREVTAFQPPGLRSPSYGSHSGGARGRWGRFRADGPGSSGGTWPASPAVEARTSRVADESLGGPASRGSGPAPSPPG